jgi:hypothetical protein
MKYDVSKIRNPEIRNMLQPILEDAEMRVYGVAEYATLVAALADTSKTVTHLLTGITLTGMLALAHAIELIGHNKALTDATLDANQYMAAQISAEGVTVRDTTFAISGNSDGNAIYSIDVGAAKSRIENNTFTMANAGSSGAVSVYYEGYTDQVLSGNTFSNGVAITGGAVMAEMKNNTFAATKGIGLGECTIGGIHYFEADPAKVAAIKAYLIAEGNRTTGDLTGLVVEGYFEA